MNFSSWIKASDSNESAWEARQEALIAEMAERLNWNGEDEQPLDRIDRIERLVGKPFASITEEDLYRIINEEGV